MLMQGCFLFLVMSQYSLKLESAYEFAELHVM